MSSPKVDKIQLHIEFITDESKAFAKTLNQTKEFKNLIEESQGKIRAYEREMKKANTTEERRAELLKKVADEELKVVENLAKIAKEAHKIEKIDLSKLTPAQLVERAKQLQFALKNIPQSAPQYGVLNAELGRTNGRLAEIKKSAKGVSDVMEQPTDRFAKLAIFAAKAGAVIGAVTGAFRGFVAGLDKSAKFEQLNIAFTTFLGSADKAKRVLADLKKFEVETPFEADQVFNAGRALLAFGFNAEELIPTLRAVGNVAAGTGKDFNELALIYGKARAEGKIQNDTLNQLAEAGIPIYEELSKILKVGQDRIRKMAEDGKIQFTDLQTVFKNLSSEGGRFSGLMEKQSKSLDGLFSTLRSAISEKLVSAISGAIPVIKQMTKDLIGLLAVPVSDKMEEERQAFNGLTLQVYNANVGTKERTALIGKLKEQYPQHLKNIDSERVTNEELKPILDKINESYIVRIALQKQAEKIQPLLEAQADNSTRLAERRVGLNKALAHGAELSGVNLLAYKSEAEQLDAVEKALSKVVLAQEAHFFATDSDKTLASIKQYNSLVETGIGAEEASIKAVSDAEKERVLVIDQLKKSYGELVDQVISQPADQPSTKKGGSGIDPEKAAKEAAKTAKEVFAARLREIELATDREEIVHENARLRNEISETVFQEKIFATKKAGLEAQLKEYQLAGDTKSIEALKTEKAILELEKNFAEQQKKNRDDALQAFLADAEKGEKDFLDRIKKIKEEKEKIEKGKIEGIETTVDDEEDAGRARLFEQFRQQILDEQQHEEQIIQNKLSANRRKLNLLAEAKLQETDVYEKTQDAILALEEDLAKKQLENQQRTQELKTAAIQAGLAAAGGAFQIGIDLLSKDEEARKKHAASIKAFEIGKVGTNLAAEVSGIWRNAQSNPINALIPGWGAAFAIIQTALSAGRAGVQVRNIRAQKFAGGGFTGDGLPFRDETGHRPAGVVHGGEWVGPKWMVQHPAYQPLFQNLELSRLRGYALGGAVSTVPTMTQVPQFGRSSTTGMDVSRFERAAEMFTAAVAQMPREVRARVDYLDIEDAGDRLNSIRNDAAY